MLQHNLLTQIDGLEFFSKLQYLVLSHNQIGQIEGVSHLGSLQYLDLAHNRIAVAISGAKWYLQHSPEKSKGSRMLCVCACECASV